MHLKYNIEEEIYNDDDPCSIKEEDFTEKGINFFLVHEKIQKIMEKKDFNSNWKISKLKFKPFSLKSQFYDCIIYLDLKNCKNISDLKITTLKNLMVERATMILHKPNTITWNDFTRNGLNLESIYNKIKQSLEDGLFEKRDTINKLFPPGSRIGKDFYTKLQTLNLTNLTDLKKVSNTRIQTLINSLEKVVYVPSTKNNSITREDLIGED